LQSQRIERRHRVHIHCHRFLRRWVNINRFVVSHADRAAININDYDDDYDNNKSGHNINDYDKSGHNINDYDKSGHNIDHQLNYPFNAAPRHWLCRSRSWRGNRILVIGRRGRDDRGDSPTYMDVTVYK
jgi:hypothetical protein